MFTKKLTTAERIESAKAKMKRVVDHFCALLEIHENNAIVLYSPTLSSQIPNSHAANAFNVFQRGLHQLEIIRLCALWDTPDPDKECIPTVIELIDHPDVLASLAEETRSHWATIPTAMLNPSDDPEIERAAAEAVRRGNEQFGDEQAAKAKHHLDEAIQAARAIIASDKLKALRNLRDKHLAHSLSITRAEKAGPVDQAKYGHERDVLEETCAIVEKLYCWVNGTSFSVKDSREIDRKNAHALWGGCRFDVLR